MTRAASLAQMGSNSLTMRNRIINGNMAIDQRANGTQTNAASGAQWSADRWRFDGDVASKITTQISTTAPAGFTKSILITSLSSYSVGASENFAISHQIEGNNIADLGWGAAGAQPVTLSFWVRSSLTGTFGGAINNDGNTRTYAFSYSISSANTWEYKTVTIAGDTSGTWLTNNNRGLIIRMGLGNGSSISTTAGSWQSSFYGAPTGAVSVVGTSGATWYITGVQLEAGTTATPFENRPYGMELALCQRYCFVIRGSQGSASYNNGLGTGVWNGADGANIGVNLPVSMRVYPSSITVSSPSEFQVVREALAWETVTTVALSTDATGPNIASVSLATATRDTRGYGARGRTNGVGAVLAFNSEL